MDMAVECESCRSRYRLNESLLRQSKAVRFRCRKCGGFIMVRNPHAPRIGQPATAPPKKTSAPVPVHIPPAAVPKIERPAPRKAPVPPPATRSPSIAVPVPPAPPVPPVPLVAPVPPAPRAEDPVLVPSGKGVVPPRAFVRSRRSPGRNLLVAGLSILLLAGGVLYFGTTQSGQDLLGGWLSSWGFVRQASAAARPVYDVRELKSAVYRNAVAGTLFVVTGTVANVGKATSHGIKTRAALLGEDNQILIENSSLAGNLIDESTLLHMARNPIEVFLKMEHREEGEAREVPPGKSLPFMVVFFDPPGKIGYFTAQAADAD